jgi:tRNA (uracil-5-)-methyltransferase TRM9
MAHKKQTQQEIWNKIASQWKEYRKEPTAETKAFLADKKDRILDLGCGSGRNFSCINKDCNLYAVDFSEEMLKYAREKAKSLNLKAEISLSRASKLKFNDNFFDSAIFIAVLHCIDSKEERLQALRELFRVLKPGAEAFITVWSKNHERIKGKTRDQLIPWGINGAKLQRYYYIYDQDELLKLLKSVGFDIVSIIENENIVAIVRKP